MAITPILQKAYWSLAIAGAAYISFLCILLNGNLQRHALYVHKIHTAWWQDLNKPEQFGFLSNKQENQVRPFNLTTPDGECLYAWHVLPLALYATHETTLVEEPRGVLEDVRQSLAFKLLSSDPESRLVINFHGNAGTVGQGWRTDTYRALASGATDKIHVLTVDYRGFGYSTGHPTEQGLISDGIALVRWALDVAHISPKRIVIVGQSLGTAVTTAVAERFVLETQTEFAGIVLVAAFSDIPTLLLTYSIGGFVPILSGLRPFPALQRFFSRNIKDTWQTVTRLSTFVRQSRNVNLVLVHSKDDFDIPWTHSNTLFYAATNATSEAGMTRKQIDGVKVMSNRDEGGYVNIWNAAGGGDGGKRNIRQEILKYGGHNRVVTYAPVAKAVFNIFNQGWIEDMATHDALYIE